MLIASAESPQFEGMVNRRGKHRRQLVAADGEMVQYYPERVAFRVTASFRGHFVDPSSFAIAAPSVNENAYLLKLRFRIVVFDGLRQTELRPESVRLIGVPREMPYNERIYRLVAELGKIQTTKRVVLEVLDPNGGRICKFHLDLL